MSYVSRRKFLNNAFYIAGCSGMCALVNNIPMRVNGETKKPDFVDNEHIFVAHEAAHYEKLPNKKIRCLICPRKCEIDDMERGFCGNRENRSGIYYVLAYANPCALHVDPIEKKPLFHFLPGSVAFSLATAGCNMVCKFCQNWDISQSRPEETKNVYFPPEEVAAKAKSLNCQSIAYTYSEPVVYYEYMVDSSDSSRKLGIKNVMVSSGYIQEKPLSELLPYLDAVKIDLKAITQKFYQEVCSSDIEHVLNTLKILKRENMWTEIVYLVIPTLNDSTQEFNDLSQWIMKNLGPDVPIHFTRFHPQYMLKNLPPTPVETLDRARKIAVDHGIHYVYVGNVPGHPGEQTYCPKCNKIIVQRIGYQILGTHINNGACEYCNQQIAGIWG